MIFTKNYKTRVNCISSISFQIFNRHPNIFKFIECLREVQDAEETTIRLLKAGASPPKQRRKYAKATSRLQRLKQNLQEGDIDAWDYCSKCSVVSLSQSKVIS